MKNAESSVDIPEWRKRTDPKRPTLVWTESGGVERDAQLPERLYRQISTGDLYLLWRDNVLPVQHFLGSHNSGIEQNSIGNFWFTEPVRLKHVEAYIVTEPAKWKPGPSFAQESLMAFRSEKKWQAAGGGEWGYLVDTSSSVPEVHTGNILSKDEITVFISRNIHDSIAKELIALEKVTPESTLQECINLVIRVKKIHEREFGGVLSHEECLQRLKTPATQATLHAFYQWMLALPILPVNVADVDDIAEDDVARKKNREAFDTFYDAFIAKHG